MHEQGAGAHTVNRRALTLGEIPADERARTPTQYPVSLGEDLSRRAVLSQNNVFNSVTSAMISAAESEQKGSLTSWLLNKSRLVK